MPLEGKVALVSLLLSANPKVLSAEVVCFADKEKIFINIIKAVLKSQFLYSSQHFCVCHCFPVCCSAVWGRSSPLILCPEVTFLNVPCPCSRTIAVRELGGGVPEEREVTPFSCSYFLN